MYLKIARKQYEPPYVTSYKPINALMMIEAKKKLTGFKKHIENHFLDCCPDLPLLSLLAPCDSTLYHRYMTQVCQIGSMTDSEIVTLTDGGPVDFKTIAFFRNSSGISFFRDRDPTPCFP